MTTFRNGFNGLGRACGLRAALLLLALAWTLALPQAGLCAFWALTGSLGQARSNHTATLLSNGKILVAGGVLGNISFVYNYLNSAALYDPATGAWTSTGSMAKPRGYHTATLLPNGKVLVAGGDYSTPPSAELYDPATGTWSVTGSPAQVRYNHTATLLPNGKVLVAGGYNGLYLASAEIYDPATGTWSATGALNLARSNHTATLLPNGRVLVAGSDSSSSQSSSELYDPVAGTWSSTPGILNVGRGYHAATLLPNGQVLVAGGYNNNTGFLASAELYDPATGTWSVTGSLIQSRMKHTATLLPNGQVIVAGGESVSGQVVVYVGNTEAYNPATGTWSGAFGLQVSRLSHTATLLPGGQVLVAGGFGSAGTTDQELASAELYNPQAWFWPSAGLLAAARAHHTATPMPGPLAQGSVLVAGGTDGTNYLSSAQVYVLNDVNSGAGTWNNTGPLKTGRAYHTATLLPSGKVLVAGGASPAYLNSAELFDPAAGTWSVTGVLNTARDVHTATLLPNGKVLVAGGYGSSGYITSAELYNPATRTWSATGSLTTARGYHTATLLPNGKVLVAGGYGNGVSNPLGSAELYDPATGTWAVADNLNGARYLHTATLLPNGQVLVAAGLGSGNQDLASAELYNPATGGWTFTGSLLVGEGRHSHTATLLPGGQVIVLGGYNGSLPPLDNLYDPATAIWGGTNGNRLQGYSRTATLLPGGQVLVAGGVFSSYQNDTELVDAGLGFTAAWRPVVSSLTTTLRPKSEVVLAGSGFLGLSEASGGATNNSATNYPLVQLRRLDNDLAFWLSSVPAPSFSATAFTSMPLPVLPAGHYLATVFTNGIPSISQVILAPAPISGAITGPLLQLLLDD